MLLIPLYAFIFLSGCTFGDSSQKNAQAPPPSIAGKNGKPVGAGQQLPTAMEALKALSPPQGLKQAQLFNEPVKDSDKRFARVEAAVQELRDEIDIATPTLVRLAAVEKDMKDLIRQLNTLVADQAKTPEQITAEQEGMPPLPLSISGQKNPVPKTSSQGKPAGQPTTQSEESTPPAVAEKQPPAKTSPVMSEKNSGAKNAPVEETPSQGKPVGQPTTQSEESMPPAVAEKQLPAKASPVAEEEDSGASNALVEETPSQGKPVGQPTTQSEESTPPAVAAKQPPAKASLNSTPSGPPESPAALKAPEEADSAQKAPDSAGFEQETDKSGSVKEQSAKPDLRALHPGVAPPGYGLSLNPAGIALDRKPPSAPAPSVTLPPAVASPPAKAKPAAVPAATLSVLDLRVGDHPDKTRIVLDLSAKPEYSARIENGKLIIELPGLAWKNGAKTWSSDTAALIYSYQVEDLAGGKGGVRIVADLLYDASIVSQSVMPALKGAGARLVIDVKSPAVHK